MKILFITSRLPYPPFRGDKLKIYNLIKQLSEKHEISLVSFIASRKEREYLQALRAYCADVEVVYLPKWRSVLNCAFNVFGRRPFQVAYFASGQMSARLSSRLSETAFDAVHVHLIRMAQYLEEKATRPPTVLDLTDAGSLYLERFLGQTRSFVKRTFIRQELGRLREYEAVLEKFDVSLVCSPVDQEVLRKRAPRADIRLLHNGVDLEQFAPGDGSAAEPFSIIYTGNMSYFPNSDGIEYFVREILPQVRRRVPGVRVYVVGQDPPRSVRRLAGPDVIVTGFAPDIREYYLRSAIAIAPIRFGAGTLNKILEPMALGVPVVATSISVEGLPVRNGEHLLVANDAGEFAGAVAALLTDAAQRERISRNAQTLVRSLYSWKVVGESLDENYRQLAKHA